MLVLCNLDTGEIANADDGGVVSTEGDTILVLDLPADDPLVPAGLLAGVREAVTASFARALAAKQHLMVSCVDETEFAHPMLYTVRWTCGCGAADKASSFRQAEAGHAHHAEQARR